MNTPYANRCSLAHLAKPISGGRLWPRVGFVLLVSVSMTGCMGYMTSSPASKIDKTSVTDNAASCCMALPSKETKPVEPPKVGETPPPSPSAIVEEPGVPSDPVDKAEAQDPEDKSVYKLPPVPEGVKRKQMTPNADLFFEREGEKETEKRRVVVIATVCLRESNYGLEGLMTRGKGKEHEYILTMDCDAKNVHTLLEAARAKAGSPVQFTPKYSPACGTPIKLTIRYEKDGKVVSIPAQQWIRDAKTKKNLAQDWVFAGSRLQPDIEDPKKNLYLANYGDVVCVTSMDTAMLDLPIPARSAPGIANRSYEAHTERIPPLGTKVELIFEPVLEKK